MTTFPEPHPGLARLRESLCAFPSRDFAEALLFATFAVRCVREIPPGNARSTSDAVVDARLRATFLAVEQWLTQPSPDALLLEVSDAAIRAAAETSGPDPRLATGSHAADWALACATATVAYAAMIGAEPEPAPRALDAEEQASDASRYALLAATCVVQAADAGKDTVTVRFLTDLMEKVWPLPPDA